MSDKYGSYTAEIEAVIERVRNLTPAELKTVEDNWIHTWTPEARPTRKRAERRASERLQRHRRGDGRSERTSGDRTHAAPSTELQGGIANDLRY